MVSAGTHRVGIIVVPRYFDTTSRELVSLVSDIDVLHTQIRVKPDFQFTLEEIVTTGDEIADCATALADAGADAVIQLGTPFSTAHGWQAGSVLRDRIEERVGLPFEMMGLSVPQAALALGLKRVALATSYYDQVWVGRYTGFVTEAGLDVVHSESFVDQGLFPTHEEAWAASFDGFTSAAMVETIRRVAAASPDIDGIVVPGLPGRFLDSVADLETEIGKPVVSYYSIWWRCLSRLGLAPIAGHGAVMGLA